MQNEREKLFELKERLEIHSRKDIRLWDEYDKQLDTRLKREIAKLERKLKRVKR